MEDGKIWHADSLARTKQNQKGCPDRKRRKTLYGRAVTAESEVALEIGTVKARVEFSDAERKIMQYNI